jgi:hypothetical protein
MLFRPLYGPLLRNRWPALSTRIVAEVQRDASQIAPERTRTSITMCRAPKSQKRRCDQFLGILSAAEVSVDQLAQ